MARYRCTIETALTPEESFDYMARFSNAVSWDPSVVSAEMVTPEPVARGSVFELVVRSLGRDLPFRYEVVEHERPERVVLRAVRGSLVSEDTVTVRALSVGGSALTYDADLRFSGPLRFVDPLLGVGFRRLGDAAAAGLRRELPALPS
jgi:dehydrogenase/reductase SDR family protein 12